MASQEIASLTGTECCVFQLCPCWTIQWQNVVYTRRWCSVPQLWHQPWHGCHGCTCSGTGSCPQSWVMQSCYICVPVHLLRSWQEIPSALSASIIFSDCWRPLPWVEGIHLTAGVHFPGSKPIEHSMIYLFRHAWDCIPYDSFRFKVHAKNTVLQLN